MKEKFKKALQFILNPRLLLCFGLAWLITNGWSYLLLGFGTYFGIGWIIAVSGAYLAFLWLPFTPEKIATVAIAIFLLRLLFPKDEKTLAILKKASAKARDVFRSRRKKQMQSSQDDGTRDKSNDPKLF